MATKNQNSDSTKTTKASGETGNAKKTGTTRTRTTTARRASGSAGESVEKKPATRTAASRTTAAKAGTAKTAEKSTAARVSATRTSADRTSSARASSAEKTGGTPKITASRTSSSLRSGTRTSSSGTSKTSSTVRPSSRTTSQRISTPAEDELRSAFGTGSYVSASSYGSFTDSKSEDAAPKNETPKTQRPTSTFASDVADYLESSSSSGETASYESISPSSSYASPSSSAVKTSYAATENEPASYKGQSPNLEDLIMEDLSSRDGKDYSTPEENPQEKRKSKAVPIILAVAGILLLAGLGTYLVVNRSPKNTGADAKKQSMPLEQRESTRALASQYMENGEYDQAISLLKAYIDENPTDAEALTLLQIAQSEKERLNAPESTDDILQTYNNLISTGDYATALRLIAATPEDTLVSQGIDGPALISKARALENGRNLMNQGAYEQAASDLGIYLSQNPGDADAEKLLNQVNRLSTLASNSNIAGIDNSAGRTDLSASDDSTPNANGNSGATSAYAGTTGDLVSLNSSSASGNAGPSSSSYEQTPVVSSFTGMNSLPEGTTSRTENQSSTGNTTSRTGNTQPVANVNPRTNGSSSSSRAEGTTPGTSSTSSSPRSEGTASGTSANAATPVRNAGTSGSTPAANTGSPSVTRTVSTISTPGANSTSSSPRTEGTASGTNANSATPVRNAGASSSTPAANTSSAPVTRTVSTISSSQVPAN
ncbi:MAG TPA: hypothetical protein DEO40_06490, partial [Treponema sp.]|nr:hypothetical protein [Treponema sp.]